MFIEMRLSHDEVGVVDPFHAFSAVEFHGVFLDAYGGLLDGAVHLRVQGHGIGFGAIVIHPEHLGIVVFDAGFELSVTVLEAMFTVPIDVIVACQVMVRPSGDGVFLGGAARQQQCRCQEEEEGPYMIISQHVESI